PILERRSSRPGDFPTFFELMTGLALFHFARERVDHAVIEVGLGGRLDATNVVDAPIVAITSIGLEHTRILGSTLGAIAREKAGIIKDGATVVVGNLPREARAVIGEVARERKARVIDVDPDHVIANADGLRWRGMPWPVAAPSIRGPALRASLALALDLHAEVLAREGRAPDPTAITEALRNLSLPGRVELFEGPPAVLIDGAHTAESFALLAECLPELALPSPRTVIFSIAADKNVEPILDLVRTIGDDFLWTRADPVRSLDPAELQARTGVGTVIEDPKEALEHALERGHSIVVCGSLYLAGTIRSALRSIQRAAEERTAQAS
ncbi:MAG TPA: hypothetical protein VK116_16745, partial [Planctomycetota bacterium]|nr:hypothetical protein [Planctomycetota bacterium]